MDNDNKTMAEWCDNIENVLSNWGEKSTAYRVLHLKSYQRWNNILNMVYIPIIVLSSLSGMLSFGSIESQNNEILMYIIGTINVAISMLTSVLKFLRCEEKSNQHKISAKGYGSFYRTITMQLNLKRTQRQGAGDFCKMCQVEFNRLHNDSLSIDEHTIEWYRKTFPEETLCLPELGVGSMVININRE